jgi:hypothetical protein
MDINLDEQALSQSLVLVIDDKPAAITGVVAHGDQPVGGAYVLLFASSVRVGDPPAAAVACDDKGKFQLAGVAPGEYRIVAVESMGQYTNLSPAAFQILMLSTRKIELSPNGVQRADLDVVATR